MEKTERPNCMRCTHYYVTWERAFPHGCRGFGIKSRHLPYVEVFRSSGQPCQLFRLKQHEKAR